MTEKFTQFSFAFDKKPIPVSSPVSSPKENKFTPITLATGLDKTHVKATAMLTLRSLISQQLKRSLNQDPASLRNRERFMAALVREIRFKQTNLEPVYLVRDTILKTTL